MFLQEPTEKVFKETNNRLNLAVFGKHPAWDDHMEDLGLVSPSLRDFKRRLYLEGVGGRLDVGAWMEMKPENRMEAFDHEMIWSGATGVIFAVLWHSSDGRGRNVYPMVAAAHFLTNKLPAKVAPIFGVLQKVADLCRRSRTRDGIYQAQAEGVERLGQAARSLVPISAGAWDAAERAAFVDAPRFGTGREGLVRVFYALRSAAGEDERGLPKGISLRIAADREGPEDLLAWQVLLRAQCGPEVPLLTMRHRQKEWLDAMAGEFDPAEFVRLKADSGEIPLTSSIPYDVSEEIRDQAEMVLDSFVTDPERIPKLDGCGSEGAGQGVLGSFLSRFFRSAPG